MHVRRLLFDHRDVSDAEHRLVMRGGGRGPEFGGSAGDARENMFRQYEANIRANAEIEKEGMKPSYKRFIDRETDRKIAEARARFNNDGTFLDIRNVQDAHQASHLLFARARGAVVEGNSIDSTPAGIKAARDARLKIAYEASDRRVDADTALMRKEIAEGKPTWQMTYFHEMPLQGQQQALANAVRRGEVVPDEVLSDHYMTREGIEDRSAARSAEVFLSSNHPNTTEFQPRSPGSRTIERRDVDSRSDEFVERYEERSEKLQKFIRNQDHSLDAEIKSTLQRATLLRDGPQKDALMRIIKKYRTKREEWGESTIKQEEEIRQLFDPSASPLDIPEHLHKAVQHVPTFEQPYFASQIIIAGRARIELPKMISDLQAEVRAVIEQNKQQTGEKVAEFIVLRRKWDAVDGTDLSPVAIRKVGEELITSIDALGSHLYVNHVQEGVAEEENAAFIADVQQRLAAQGVPAVDEEDMKLLTPDRQGMRHMLVVKNEVLQKLCKNQEGDVLLRRRLVAALARTERTFIEHGGSKEEIEEVNAQRAVAEFQMASLSRRLTDVATLNPNPAKPGEGLAAAQRERFVLEELLSNPDVDRHVRENLEKRLGELKRSPEALGIIGEECYKVLDPLQSATNALAIDTLATSADCIAALVTIRAEGSMLWKLRSDLHPEAVAGRLNALIQKQWQVIEKRWQIERAAAGKDPQKISEAIAASARELGGLRTNELNTSALAAFEQTLVGEARAMRGPVNAAILAAKADKPLNIEHVQSAVEMIAAEERALRALGIDGDRVESIRKELALIDDLGKDVEAKVIQGKQLSPDLAKFKEMSALLHQEDVMVRAVFHADPERLAKRIASIEQQRESLMKSFNDAVDAVVKNLDEITSTSEQVRKASELLEEAFRQKGGDRMSDVQELARFQAMRKNVDAVRAAAENRRIAEVIRAEVLRPIPTPDPVAAPVSVRKSTSSNNSVLSGPTAQPPELATAEVPSSNVQRANIDRDLWSVNEESAQVTKAASGSPSSSVLHAENNSVGATAASTPEAFPVTSAPSEVHAAKPSEPSSDVPTLAEYARPLQIELAAARVLLQQVDISRDARQIDRISAQLSRLSKASHNVSDPEYIAIKDRLLKAMQDLLVERGTPEDIRRAQSILLDRYGPAIESLDDGLSIETHVGLSRQQLLTELDEPNGLLQKSQEMNLEDVQRPLMEMRRKIQSLKDRPEVTEEEFAAEIKADLARRIPITPDQVGKREASMVAAESAVATAETLAQAPNVTIPQLEQALKALVESDKQANDFDPEESSNRFKAWHERKPAAQEKLSQRLFAACLESPTRESIDRAYQIFIGRYKQFQVESAHNARRLLAKESDASPSSDIDPYELHKELMGDDTLENTGLLSKAVSFNLSEKVIRELLSIEKDLHPYSPSSHE